MAGKYGSPDVTISIEDAPGGTARAMESFTLEMGGVKITAMTEESTVFGSLWEQHLPTGLRRVEPITLTGFFETTATTGSHAVFQVTASDAAAAADTREVVIVFGDSKTFTFDVRLQSYEVLGAVGAFTRFTAELLPSGAGVWS